MEMRIPISLDQFLLAILASALLAGMMLMVQRDALDYARTVYEPKIERLEKELNTETVRIVQLEATLNVLNMLEEWSAIKPLPVPTLDSHLIPWPTVHLVRVPPVVLPPFNDVLPPGANCDKFGCTLKRKVLPPSVGP